MSSECRGSDPGCLIIILFVVAWWWLNAAFEEIKDAITSLQNQVVEQKDKP